MTALLLDSGEAVTFLEMVLLDGDLLQYRVRGEDGLRKLVHPCRVVAEVTS